MAGSSNGDRPGADRGSAGRGARPKSPVDQWFEVFVYAPLGFALDARQLFPKFVDRGRSQVVLARVIGKYAVKHGSTIAGDRLGQSQSQIAAVLQTLGWLPEENEADDTADVEAFEADEVVFHDEPAPAAAPGGPAAPGDAVESIAPEGAEPTVPAGGHDLHAVSVDDLAIPDYDNLSASQVVPRLAGLSTAELEAVRRYEAARRGRKTILNKIAQLQSA
ncbi:MAG: hypothetical protein ACXWA3_02515 [Acidimicrobiales bacterium]